MVYTITPIDKRLYIGTKKQQVELCPNIYIKNSISAPQRPRRLYTKTDCVTLFTFRWMTEIRWPSGQNAEVVSVHCYHCENIFVELFAKKKKKRRWPEARTFHTSGSLRTLPAQFLVNWNNTQRNAYFLNSYFNFLCLLHVSNWAGWRCRYSDWPRAGRYGGRIPMEARSSAPVQTGSGAHPASCTMGTGSFPGVKSGRGVTLNPHPFLVPWSRKSRAIPPLPLWTVRPVQSLSACTV